ncbi:AraC-like DNA-binding protein [Chitinophaga niastensis]|uniref:AraC-like DNA-binding protein n=1 Tax=Chitinophaga niastensis TaxID=536980 RepID=A0A2P8HHL0_CHINA|nr:AraC family transcriptional regulator [Chitinophaga niastensis]PSL45679.1 AraC-like DNA-binding protein [Chitinophaga niastensis]
MSLQLTTANKEEISYQKYVPQALLNHVIANAQLYYCSGDYGQLIFQEIAGSDFSIWYSEYLIAQNTTIYAYGDEPCLELHFTLNNKQVCDLEGLGNVVISAWQYNIIYLPFVQSKSTFKQGKGCTSFDIHFSKEYLFKLIPYFPLIGQFMENVDREIACIFSPQNAAASPQMIAIINKILYCGYTGVIKDIYLENKAHELLLLALEKLTWREDMHNDMELRPDDIERLQEARNLLLQNMDNPCSLRELAHKVFINEFKLKKGFKQLFGATVFDFLLNARMEKAYLLLTETDMLIKEITMITGYKNVSNFTAAFKKKYGYPPGRFKNNLREEITVL